MKNNLKNDENNRKNLLIISVKPVITHLMVLFVLFVVKKIRIKNTKNMMKKHVKNRPKKQLKIILKTR